MKGREPPDDRIDCRVIAVYPEAEKPYAVTVPLHGGDDSITFGLDHWTDAEPPHVGDHVALWTIRQRDSGLRAYNAEPIRAHPKNQT